MFFFTSKTACEMRISDWSSDVCSSDLVGVQLPSPFTDHLVDVVSLELLAPAAIHRGTRHHVARPLEDANPRRDDRRQDAAETALQGKACEIHTTLADRKGVVWGKTLQVGVDSGDHGIIKKKKKN